LLADDDDARCSPIIEKSRLPLMHIKFLLFMWIALFLKNFENDPFYLM
jgi:hypothetical protein